eukprot:713830-Prymnesium_polylepis.1
MLGLRHLAHVRVHAVRARRVALARGGTAAAPGGGGRDTRPHRPRSALTQGESAARGNGARGGHAGRGTCGWLCGSRPVPGAEVCLHVKP